MGKKSNHILNAIDSIAKAQQELESRVDHQERKANRQEKIIESQGRDIAKLEMDVMQFRNSLIQAEVASGEPSGSVAKKYGVTASRVTQIAPRKRFHRSNLG